MKDTKILNVLLAGILMVVFDVVFFFAVGRVFGSVDQRTV